MSSTPKNTPIMKKKYHYEGRDDDGTDVFSECGSDRSLGLKSPEYGEPLQPGQAVVQVKPLADREHFEIDTIVERAEDGTISGPAQVATEEYRNGWDATFGAEQGRPN